MTMTIDRRNLIQTFQGALQAKDFERVAALVDRHQAEHPVVCERARIAQKRIAAGGPVQKPNGTHRYVGRVLVAGRRGQHRVGLYTIVFRSGPFAGEHLTLRVKTYSEAGKFFQGKTVLGYLSGPDNQSDYTNFGFVKELAGEQCEVIMWKKFRNSDTKLHAATQALLGDPLQAAQAYGLESRSCAVCGRTLTDPESLTRGIGPVCAEKFN